MCPGICCRSDTHTPNSFPVMVNRRTCDCCHIRKDILVTTIRIVKITFHHINNHTIKTITKGNIDIFLKNFNVCIVRKYLINASSNLLYHGSTCSNWSSTTIATK